VKLRDIAEVVGPLIDIFESGNSRFDSLDWEEGANGFLGTGTIGDIKLRIRLEPSAYLLADTHRVWLNIAFEREVDGAYVQNLLGTHEKVSIVLGAIRSATVTKLIELNSQFQIDALAGIAVDGELDRLRLYDRLFSSPTVGLPGWNKRHLRVKVAGGEAEVALSPELSKHDVDLLLADLQTKGKIA
jgi:hypothetical protein